MHIEILCVEYWKSHDGITSVEAIKALGISDDLVEVQDNGDSESDGEGNRVFDILNAINNLKMY